MKVNYLAVIVAAIVHFFLGGIWYSLLFANKFIQLMSWTTAQMNEIANQSHAKEYIAAFASSLILVYILAHFIQFTKATTALAGALTAFWLWLGFIVTTQIATVIFEGRNAGLYLLNIGYQLVACAIAGIILALWRPRAAAE
jgi:Protein of unknown function (DUF1761)